jgi:hypothetical protein
MFPEQVAPDGKINKGRGCGKKPESNKEASYVKP